MNIINLNSRQAHRLRYFHNLAKLIASFPAKRSTNLVSITEYIQQLYESMLWRWRKENEGSKISARQQDVLKVGRKRRALWLEITNDESKSAQSNPNPWPFDLITSKTPTFIHIGQLVTKINEWSSIDRCSWAWPTKGGAESDRFNSPYLINIPIEHLNFNIFTSFTNFFKRLRRPPPTAVRHRLPFPGHHPLLPI